MKMATKEKTEDKLHKIPLRITDTTLRDAHQSLWATRMRTEDILRIIDVIDSVGYYSLEVWGGATFDVCLRFLRENPWERLRMIKAKAKNTPLQMLLRGQNLVGYRNYADDVVDRFVALACENGIDIFRVFDALNDTRNLEAAIKAVKRHGGHAQGTLAYTISPVHTVEKYVQYAKEQVDQGIDSLCIKDMAGILSPIGAERLVSALVDKVGVPIQLHCHATSGMATATYVEAVRAGAGAIDCAISSMAGSSSQPPVETLAAIFNETNYAANLNFEAMDRVAKFDPGILIHQIPGGMISNFRSQLDKQKALDKLPQALEEVARVREDLGFPPLVTPTSQIVGTQAVMNVLSGERYKIIPNEVKAYVKGMYGRSPAAINAKLVKMILGEDEKPIKHRPADMIKPMLPNATEGLPADLVEHEEDIISYILLPEPALEYFQWRKLPPEQRPEIPADVELKKIKSEVDAINQVQKAEAAAAPAVAEVPATPQLMVHREDYEGFGLLLSRAAGLQIDEFTVRKGDFSITVHATGAGAASVKAPAVTMSAPGVQPAAAAPAATAPKPAAPAAAAPSSPAAYAHTVKSPLVGTFYSSPGPGKPAFVKIGDTVKAGDKICIVEAMKLFNEIEAPQNCKILAFLVKEGATVEKGQPIIAIEPA
jgi:oxaloacetate decarboxylase alpha subunit